MTAKHTLLICSCVCCMTLAAAFTPEDTANNASPEEIRERNSRAGKASAKARKRKKELKELLLLALSQPQEGKPEEDNYMGITVALIQKALKGDTKAFEIIRDTIGQKPIEQLDINSNKININITGDEDD